MSRVLLAAHDQDVLDLWRMWLVGNGHSVVGITDPALARSAAAQADVAVVAHGGGFPATALLSTLVVDHPGLRGVLVAGPHDATGWDGEVLHPSMAGRALLAVVSGTDAPTGSTDPDPARRGSRSSSMPRPAPSPELAPGREQGPCVLVVDDEDDLRDLLVAQLTCLGYRAVPAPDGQHALDLLATQHADALLLDIDMPGLDGHAVLRAVRADPRTADLAVVVLTARTQGSDVALGLELGADDFVRKPFSLVEVAARLRTAIARGRERGRLIDLRDQIVPAAPRSRAFLDPAVAYRPSDDAAAGGDFHCLVDGPGGTTFAVVGDVGGHGPAVAAMAAHCRAVATNHAATSTGPGELLASVNRSVLDTGDGPDGDPTLATMLCLLFDPASGRVTAATAGHPPPLRLATGREVGMEAGPPLGVTAHPDFPVTEVDAAAGWAVMLYTDGLTEARSPADGEFFGDRALPEVVTSWTAPSQDRGARPHEVVEGVMAGHRRWVGGHGSDDVTVLVLALTDAWATRRPVTTAAGR